MAWAINSKFPNKAPQKAKPTLIWQIFLLVFATVFLSAALATIVFSVTGTDAFVNIKSNELITKGRYVADITSMYLQGQLTNRDYKRALGDDRNIFDAAVYACNDVGSVFLYPKYLDTDANREMISRCLGRVLNGEEIVDLDGVIIAYPAKSAGGDILGAVFLIKPIADITAALSRITDSLMISMAVVLLLMIVFSYFATRSIVSPINRMTKIALSMASGDFSRTAPVTGTAEIAVLGQSLNYLSSTLKDTIADLVHERNRLKSLIDGMSDGLLTMDSVGKITDTNAPADKMLNPDINPHSAEVLDKIRDAVSKLAANPRDNLIEFDTDMGEAVVHITITELNDENGSYMYSLVLLHDITEAARYEQARRDYVANVSHELRTPIASIRGLADVLYDGLIKSDEDKHRYCGNIIKESKRMSRLIDDLLELSRLQSGMLAFEIYPVNIYELIDDALNVFVCDELDESKDKKRIVTHLDDNLPTVYTNDDRAEQVLIVMLDNARKHAQGDITVCAVEDKANNKVIISVENGGEIDESDLPHLFERFYKVDKAHTGNGTGLGLSIAKEVMEILNERIWAESTNGTVKFSFTLSTLRPREWDESADINN